MRLLETLSLLLLTLAVADKTCDPTENTCDMAAVAASSTSAPFAVMVQVEIAPDRVEAFLEAMAIDVAGSRQEEGCLRFGQCMTSIQGIRECMLTVVSCRSATGPE